MTLTPPRMSRTRCEDWFAARSYRHDRFADVAHGTAAAIGDNGGGNGGAFATIFLINILNNFLAPLMFKVHINIRRLVTLA